MSWTSILAAILSGLVLPSASYAIASYRAGRKEINGQAATIVRLREERAKTATIVSEHEQQVLKEGLEGLRQDVRQMTGGLHELEIKIAQQYVTSIALKQMEDRFSEWLTRLEQKLDDRAP